MALWASVGSGCVGSLNSLRSLPCTYPLHLPGIIMVGRVVVHAVLNDLSVNESMSKFVKILVRFISYENR